MTFRFHPLVFPLDVLFPPPTRNVYGKYNPTAHLSFLMKLEIVERKGVRNDTLDNNDSIPDLEQTQQGSVVQ